MADVLKPVASRGLLRASLWAMPAGIVLWALLAALSIVIVDACWEHQYHVGTTGARILKLPAVVDFIHKGDKNVDLVYFEIPVCGARINDPAAQQRLNRWIERKNWEGYDLMSISDGCVWIFRRRRS